MRRATVKVAIAHDYITQRGGAERVLLAMARTFPDAPIYTTLFEPSSTFAEFAGMDIRVSPLNRVKLFRKFHRGALLALPFAASSMRIDAEVVLASSSGWAHGFRSTGRKIVYCYSPARWLYQPELYLGERASRIKTAVLGAASSSLRNWDSKAAASATRYLAISSAVKQRIADTYGIEADVLFAPHSVDVSLSQEPVSGLADGYFLCVSRLLPYKNVDKIIDAMRLAPDRRLVIVGRGPEHARIAASLPPNAVLLSDVSDSQMRWLYSHSRAIIAASYEDFGLTPIEGGIFGKPAAVLRWGGFLDTVSEDVSGVFFDQPTASLIAAALDRLESRSWDAAAIKGNAARFGEERFADSLRKSVASLGTSMEGVGA